MAGMWKNGLKGLFSNPGIRNECMLVVALTTAPFSETSETTLRIPKLQR
jgi:hypothetical protein